jgi:hypothetical protein
MNTHGHSWTLIPQATSSCIQFFFVLGKIRLRTTAKSVATPNSYISLRDAISCKVKAPEVLVDVDVDVDEKEYMIHESDAQTRGFK